MALTSNFASYVRWWTDELRGALPTWMSAWFAGDSALGEVGADQDALHVVSTSQGRARILKSVPHVEVSTSPVFREMVAKEQDRVRLVLSPGQILVRQLTLPAAIEENLVEALGFEIDRVTPFKVDQAHYMARVTSRDAQKETIDVLLVVLPRGRLESLLAATRQAGLSVVEAGAEPGLTGGQFIDLMPANMKPARKWGQMTRVNLALAAAAAVLLMMAMLLPVWQKREQVIALIPMVDKTASEFATTRKIFDEYAKLAGEYNYIATKKHATQPVMSIIEEVTRISPDTTYTQTLELKTSGKVRELMMMGEASSASKVIESLEQSPLFQNASQKSQTTRGSQINTERFHVATEVKPRQVPAAVLVELEPVATSPVVPALPQPVPSPSAIVDPKVGGSESKAGPSAPVPAMPVSVVPLAATPGSASVPLATVQPAPLAPANAAGGNAKSVGSAGSGKPASTPVPTNPVSTPTAAKGQP